MPPKKITLEEIETAAQEIHHKISITRNRMLNQMADLQGSRATRLTEVAVRLEAELGANHLKVVEFKRAAAAATASQAAFKQTAAREAKVPKIMQHEWLVFGQILDQAGNPITGLRVRVFDRDRKYDDLLGDTATDEYGDFSVVYHERDFAEARENLPELYVLVSDAEGKELFTSRDNIRFEAGKSEYFAIRLEALPETNESKSGTTKKSRKRKS